MKDCRVGASAAMPTWLRRGAQPPPPGAASPAGRAGRRGSIRRLSIVRRESTAGAAEAAGDADVCLMCFKQIPEDAEYCPLDDARPDDGPKVHVECWEPFFADTASTKCKWCFKPVIAPKPTVSATQGGGSRAIPGRGPLLGSGTVAFHQQCVDKWQEKFGNKCAFCGKAVVEGVFVEGAGMTHKGFCCAPPAQFGAQFGAIRRPSLTPYPSPLRRDLPQGGGGAAAEGGARGGGGAAEGVCAVTYTHLRAH